MKTSIKGVDPEWYTLQEQEGEERPAQFYIKPLDGMQVSEIVIEYLRPATGEIGPKGVTEAFRVGVKNWKNIEDGNNPGEDLPFNRANMNAMRWGWILEVGKRVLEISDISEEQRKN